MRKPLGILAEGLLVPLSGGKRKPVELFVEGISGVGGEGLLFGRFAFIATSVARLLLTIRDN